MAFKCFRAPQGAASCATRSLPRIRLLDSSSSSVASAASRSSSSLAFRGGCFLEPLSPSLLLHRLPRPRPTPRRLCCASSEQQPQLFRTSSVEFDSENRRIQSLVVDSDSRNAHHQQLQGHVGVDSSSGELGGLSWRTLSPLHQDLGVTVLVLAGAWAWVRLFDFLTKQQLLGQKLSRKLVHITSGLLFVLCWPLYSAFPWAQYLAALVPLCNGLRLLVYGFGLLRDEGLVKSVSREGDPRELLRGPLYYVVVLVFSTILFWRDSPVGMMALSMMCGGDGIADIVGRKFGAQKLPWNEGKSWAGSVAMFLFGMAVSYGCLCYFQWMGFYQLDTRAATLVKLAVVAMAATLVESLPVSTKLDDNVTVPLTTIVVGMMLFPTGGRALGIL